MFRRPSPRRAVLVCLGASLLLAGLLASGTSYAETSLAQPTRVGSAALVGGHLRLSLSAQSIADLSVANVASQKSAKIGELVTSTITVTNLGPGVATGLVVGVNVTDQLDVVSVDCGAGPQQGRVFCPFASLAPGARVVVRAVTTPCCLPRGESRLARVGGYVYLDPPYATVDSNSANDWAEVTLKVIGAHSR